MLQDAGFGFGFGLLVLQALLCQNRVLGLDSDPTKSTTHKTHHPAKAKSINFLFMEGGPSHIDLFDPKPRLEQLAGQPLPPSFKPIITPMGEYNAPLMPSKRAWKQHGNAGTWVSDWLPHTAQHVDNNTTRGLSPS
jgi:hypothetical protein